MNILLGLLLLYIVPAFLGWLFWLSPWLVRRLIGYWVGRDVMLGFIPKPADVHHTERLLGIKNTPDRT